MPAEAEQSTVYRVDFDDRYAGLVLADEADMDALGEFRGSPRAEDWKPVRMRWEHHGASYPQPDFAYVLGTIAISARAREAIGELLDGRVECLSVDVEDGEPVWLANVLHLSDALDEADSEFAYFRSGRIIAHRAPCLPPRAPPRRNRLPCSPGAEVYLYATERFKRAVEEAGLSGLRFLAT